MRLHSLTVTAFGAFAGTARVDFDALADAGLFLLHGETGAGKTTLLDAVAFALYGRVPGERGKARRLRSDHAAPDTRTEVTLEATVGGRRLRITRSPQRERPKQRGTGTTTEQAGVCLAERLGRTWSVRSTRVGEADAEIEGAVGMSAEQFFQVVLLPQGQFARFLHADTDQRAALLKKLFHTDRFHDAADWLADRRRSAHARAERSGREIDTLTTRIAQVADVYPPGTAADGASDPVRTWAGELAAAAARTAGDARLVAQRCAAELDAAQDRHRAAQHLADLQRRRAEALRRRDELTAAEPAISALRAELVAADKAAGIAWTLDEADRAAAALIAARGAETAARAAATPFLETAGAGPADATQDLPADTLRAAAEECQRRIGRLDGLRELAAQAAADEEQARTARLRAEELDSQRSTCRADLDDRRDRRAQAVAARDDAVRAQRELAGVRFEAGVARGAAADAAALHDDRIAQRGWREANLAAREDALDRAETALRIRQARLEGMGAELAAGLRDGAPCPVCGSADHPNPARPATGAARRRTFRWPPSRSPGRTRRESQREDQVLLVAQHPQHLQAPQRPHATQLSATRVHRRAHRTVSLSSAPPATCDRAAAGMAAPPSAVSWLSCSVIARNACSRPRLDTSISRGR